MQKLNRNIENIFLEDIFNGVMLHIFMILTSDGTNIRIRIRIPQHPH